ncbi:SpoIIE family protein phosphatase [Tenuifilum sp. 4138str]
MKQLVYSFCFLAFTISYSFSQVNSLGQPFIKNYTLKDYKAKSQNWAIAKDSRGVMYFANNDGVLEYDGRNWELIGINKGAIARSLAIDSTGTIYVGAENEFGCIQPDGLGKLYYSSFSDLLPSQGQGFSDINKVYITNSGVLFCSNKKIFRYHSGKISVIDLPKGGFLSFMVNNKLFMGDYWEGLMLLEYDKFVPCKGGKFFAKKDVFGVLPYGNDLLLIATSNNGLYLYNPFTGITDRPKQSGYSGLHKIITDKTLYGISILNNGFIINTLYGGAVVVDSSFQIKEIYSKAGGLQDEVVLGVLLARQGFVSEPLWMSLNNGISKVEINNPFRVFNENQGLNQEILDIFQYNQKLYFATINGVYTLESNGFQPFFKKIEQTEGECWSITECSGSLIIGGAYNFYIHNGQKTTRVETNDMIFKVYSSKKYPNKIYVGENKGLSVFNFERGKLYRISKLDKITERVTNIIEDKRGNLWLTTIKNELIKVSISPQSTIITNFTDSLATTEPHTLYPFCFENNMYFVTSNSLLLYDENADRLVPAKDLDSSFIAAAMGLTHYAEDLLGNIWLVSVKNGANQISLLEKQGESKFKVLSTPFKRLPPCIFNAIFPDSHGVTWLGTSEGLITFNTKTPINFSDPCRTLIRKVYLGEDSLIFSGTFTDKGKVLDFQPQHLIPVLKYRNNGLTFHFSAPYFIEENETQYSYFLEGFDSEKLGWSNWANEAKKEYTNLPEGNYTFKVKAKNIFGIESLEAQFSFRIKPPWYRTIFAYILYLVVLSVFVWIVVKLNIRRLEKEKERLEGIVLERTAEIRQQKEKIEKQKEEITDSIKYAKRIQTAVLPPPELISVHLPEHFILFKPRDIVSGDFYWMKQIGDFTLITAADCTGHGVPGAFMSMLGVALLNEIASRCNGFTANQILNELRNQVKQSLRQTGKEGEAKDGMDIAFCVLNRKIMKLQYAGAYNPLYLYRRKEFPNPSSSPCVIESDTHYLIEVKADKMPIGIHVNDNIEFTNHEIDLSPGDTIYIFSDGFADQTGGETDKKFLSKNFKNLLLNIQHLEMAIQKEFLEETLKKWMGNTSQVDDILVIGVRV